MKKGYLVAAFAISGAGGIGIGLLSGLMFGLSGSGVAGVTAGFTSLIMSVSTAYFSSRSSNVSAPGPEGSSEHKRGGASPPQP